MKKRKFLLPLVMAIVMMAMSPTKMWADDIPADMFCFEATADNSSVKMNLYNGGSNPLEISLEYYRVVASGNETETYQSSTDWADFIVGTTQVNLKNGDKVYIRAKTTNDYLSEYGASNIKVNYFVMTGSIKVSGNIMYLLDKDATATTQLSNYMSHFASLFSNPEPNWTNTALKDASGLILPATTMKERCYMAMFARCVNLTAAPALPATTLANECYYSMFYGCRLLTTAPTLPATTLATGCYNYMFNGCTSLNKVTAAFGSWGNTSNWLNGVATTGDFNAISSSLDLTVARSTSTIPSGWTVNTINWTITPGKATLEGSSAKIPVTISAKFGETAWVTELVNSTTTVEFWNIAALTKICEGTLSGTEADGYYITVSDLNALKALQGQSVTIKFPADALKASETAGTAPYLNMPLQTATFTVPADVTFSFSNTDYNHVDDSQLMTGFNLIVTAGTEAPTLDNDKRFLLSYGEDYVVVLDPTPTLVAGTTNQWKYTAKVKTNEQGYIMTYSPSSQQEYADHNHKAVPMIAGNHSFTLTVPAGAFTSGWSTNTAAVGVTGYDLYPKAVFTFTTDGVIKDGSNYTFIVNLKATAPTGASDDDKNPYVGYGDNWTQGWTVSDYNGTVGVACVSAGTYKITLDYSKLATKSSYVLTIPAGKFKAHFNQNEKTYLSFTIAERPQWTKAADYAVSIDEADGVATIVPTKNNLPLTILDKSMIVLYRSYGQQINADFMVVPGSSELKVIADFSAELAPYYVMLRDGSVKAGNTVYMEADNNNADVARIDVTANFTFVDASVTGETATTKDDVKAKTYSNLTYKRNYTGKTETLYVPFDIKPTAENQILDNVYLWKLVNITEENGNPVFNFSQVENGATLYANKPYLIRRKDGTAGEYTMTLKNAKTETPISNSVKSSTTTDTYSFTGVIEPSSMPGETGKLWIVKSSTGYLINVPTGENATLDPWRWYMTTTSKNISYAKFNLDGDIEDTTGIGRIENGELIIDNSAIYNLNGQRLSKPQRGINIINGKKVFVK